MPPAPPKLRPNGALQICLLLLLLLLLLNYCHRVPHFKAKMHQLLFPASVRVKSLSKRRTDGRTSLTRNVQYSIIVIWNACWHWLTESRQIGPERQAATKLSVVWIVLKPNNDCYVFGILQCQKARQHCQLVLNLIFYVCPNMWRLVQGGPKNGYPVLFWDNVGNSAPILTILSLLQAEIYGA